jgi:hypothetical protein
MNPNKYDSLIVYQWINTLLRSMVGPEQKVPAKGELDISLISEEDSYPEITISMRFMKAKLQRIKTFLTSQPKKNWPLTYDFLIYLVHSNLP